MGVLLTVAVIGAAPARASAEAPLSASRTSFELLAGRDGTARGTFSLSAPDEVSTQVRLASSQPWLVVPSQVMTSQPVVLKAVATGLRGGIFDATVTATSATYAPAMVKVRLTALGGVVTDIDFQPRYATLPHGYYSDFGQAFGVRSTPSEAPGLSYGWVVPGTQTPLSLAGNARERLRQGVDTRSTSHVMMQAGDAGTGAGAVGTRSPGAWEIALPEDRYSVTVGVGDAPVAGAYDSAHSVRVEGVQAIDRFRSTAAAEYRQATVVVDVKDGRLTLSPEGGTNTKITFVRIVTAPTNLKVDFATGGVVPPAGYFRDIGQSYGRRTSGYQGFGLAYGWVTVGTSTPRDMTTQTRNRTSTSTSDVRLKAFTQMQPVGVQSTAWEVSLPSGSYSVTVGVGDGQYLDSAHTISVEGRTIVSSFTPTSAKRFATGTVTVGVTDGRLTLDALGGVNTKIGYVDITSVTASSRPSVRSVHPPLGATGVRRDTPVTAELVMPNHGAGVDATTITDDSVRLMRAADGVRVPAQSNTSGGGDVIVLQPKVPLEASTAYVLEITPALEDQVGASFLPFTSSFTTGTQGGPAEGGITFAKESLPNATGKPYTSLVFGPDHRLYAATLDGQIDRFPVEAGGILGRPTTITTVQARNGGARTVLGLAFEPSSTATAPVLWVTHNAYAFANAPDWTGKVSRLSGPELSSYQDVVVRLPRSVRDHETNSLVFGPDGALYFPQGAMSSGGAPDGIWGGRAERLLAAAVLRLDPDRIGSLPLDAKTEEGGTYDPYAPGAPLTLFATGVRNAFDLVWASNGHLYAPTNGSGTGGNTPSEPATASHACARRADVGHLGPYQPQGTPPIRDMAVAEQDWLFDVQRGGYYGHPNPLRCEYSFNGGNPTTGLDPGESSEYPVGTRPDRNYRGGLDLGAHFSPNGAVQYQGDAFGGALKGKLLVTRYSSGKDVVAFDLAPDGAVTGTTTGIDGFTGFSDPLDITEDVETGFLYVTELAGERITLLRPGAATGGVPALTPSPALLTQNAVVGKISSSTTDRVVTISNKGNGTLRLTGLGLAGTNASEFVLNTPLTLPASVSPGTSVSVHVGLNPRTPGTKSAVLRILSSDPARAIVEQRLRGVASTGTTEGTEPSLHGILWALGNSTLVGDPDPVTPAMPADGLLGEEISAASFVKRGAGPVRVRPVAVFSAGGGPVLEAGWYPAATPGTRRIVASVYNKGAATYQTVNPTVSGVQTFDPGTASFGIWGRWAGSQGPLALQDDALNPSSAHRARVYPKRAADGSLVVGTYLVALEQSCCDWNDAVLEVSGVQPVSG